MSASINPAFAYQTGLMNQFGRSASQTS